MVQEFQNKENKNVRENEIKENLKSQLCLAPKEKMNENEFMIPIFLDLVW